MKQEGPATNTLSQQVKLLQDTQLIILLEDMTAWDQADCRERLLDAKCLL